MIVLAVALAVYVLAGLAYWLAMAYGIARTWRGVPRLERVRPPAPAAWPRLSVIVPACNEADTLEPAMRTLIEQDYPDLEIVAVDDRSTDATGEIADRLAAENPRVKAIHVKELPAGWLGKVHALERGLRASSGTLVLFTDADIHFGPGALGRAVAYAEAEGLDHLAALPDLWPTSRSLDAGIAMFIRQLLVFARVWKVRDPRSRAAMGVGAFNLVRRAALEKTAGLEWLRLETADDVGLGLLMKQSGARCAIVTAFEHVRLTWYRTWGEAARGAEKGYASTLNFSVRRAVVAAAMTLGLELAPFLSLIPLAFESVRPVGYVGLATLAAYLFTAIATAGWAGRGKLLPALTSPLVAPIAAALTMRVGVLGRRRGGVLWRGTLYPTELLRGGKRVKIL